MHAMTKQVPASAWLGSPEAGEARHGRQSRPDSSVPPLLIRRYTEDYVAAGRALARLLADVGTREAGRNG
ncbi:MAG: hypothetical protein IRY86_05455 [Thermorudis peleae]|nr:hypothetical protein [Thermorudis peleae]